MAARLRRLLSDSLGRIRQETENADTKTKRLVSELAREERDGWTAEGAARAADLALSLSESGIEPDGEAESLGDRACELAAVLGHAGS